MIGRAVVLLVLASAIAQAQNAVAPKLEPPVAPTVGRDVEPAQALPSVVTICIDRAARQCWTASGPAVCQTPSRPGAEAFDVLPARSSAAGTALRACWAKVTK
jgi:hypothetical protein